MPGKAFVALVEDDADLLDTLQEVIRTLGYEVRPFASAAAALEQLTLIAQAGVLLTDYKMLGMNGVELIERARALSPKLPVALITAHKHPDVQAAAQALENVAVFFKPFDIDALEAYLAKVLGKRANT